MRRRRSKARVVGLVLMTIVFALALVFFPKLGRVARAGPSGAGSSTASAKPPPDSPATKSAKHAAPSVKAPAKGGPSAAHAVSDIAAPEQEPPAPASPPSPAPSDDAAGSTTTLPRGKGLPVLVSVGVFFLELKSFDDNKGEFECTSDLRLRWSDPRLRFPASEAFRGFKEYRGKEAEAQLEKVWNPTVEAVNRLEASSYVGRRLRVFPDGQVETLTRTTARYKTHVDPERFPFDRQHLVVELIAREETTDELQLRFEKEEVEFSRKGRKAQLDGWDLGLVDLKGSVIPGWNGDRYSRVTASLFVDRVPTSALAPIFIPLVASLLIPLLALWMNRATEDGFEVDAFELANMGIGGLFSVIALSFAIYSSYGSVAGSDNTVTRLFGLNYAMLATSLCIVVLFFRFNLPMRWFGRYVHEQAFAFLTWALPSLTLGTSVALLLVAAA